MAVTTLSLEELKQRLRHLGLYGLFAHAEDLINEPWIARLLEIEESERLRRSLKRRLDYARLGAFKPMADFDYNWPKELDRSLLDELFTLGFLEQAANIVIVGPNGLGKSMVAKNLLHQPRHSSAITAHCSSTALTSSSPLAHQSRQALRPAARRSEPYPEIAHAQSASRPQNHAVLRPRQQRGIGPLQI